MKKIILFIGLILLSAVNVYALPSDRDESVIWTFNPTPNDPEIGGFYIYFAKEGAEGSWTDAQRFKINNPDARESFIIDFTTGRGDLCFQVTAFSLSSGKESGFAKYEKTEKDACGWFGMTAPDSVGIKKKASTTNGGLGVE